jgi:hypothetical protein
VRATPDAVRGLARCSGASQTLSVLTSVGLAGGAGQLTTDSIDGRITIAPCSD